MQIALDNPDSIAGAIAPDRNLARAALEALALEAYRNKRLGESGVRRLLNFGTSMEVHAFLAQHGVPLHYDHQDLEHDLREADRVAAILKERQSGERVG